MVISFFSFEKKRKKTGKSNRYSIIICSAISTHLLLFARDLVHANLQICFIFFHLCFKIATQGWCYIALWVVYRKIKTDPPMADPWTCKCDKAAFYYCRLCQTLRAFLYNQKLKKIFPRLSSLELVSMTYCHVFIQIVTSCVHTFRYIKIHISYEHEHGQSDILEKSNNAKCIYCLFVAIIMFAFLLTAHWNIKCDQSRCVNTSVDLTLPFLGEKHVFCPTCYILPLLFCFYNHVSGTDFLSQMSSILFLIAIRYRAFFRSLWPRHLAVSVIPQFTRQDLIWEFLPRDPITYLL